MEEKCAALKLQLASKAKEAQFFQELDHLALSGDREQRMRHRKAMTAYRDENKRVRPHACIMHSLLMLLRYNAPYNYVLKTPATLKLPYAECLWFHSHPCVCSANGAALEGQSTNTLPGGSEGERAAQIQPH